ncbi:MAG: ribosome recycling factor [Clostridiales bacterium]|jgi:ribosome recycling factor|nr:ribosome recycling factor [Clostridiales bacterium]
MDSSIEKKMTDAIDYLIHELGALRVGRANPAVIEPVKVDYYGVPTPITQLGNVSVPEPRTLMIQPYDAGILGEIEKAIAKSDLGMSPNNDGKVIRLNFPPLTEERRRDVAKQVSAEGEKSKVRIRNVRREAIDELKKQLKAKEITEDELKDSEKDIQNVTDKRIKEVDDIVAKKEKEIMEN